MTEDGVSFRTHCERMITELSNEQVNNFKNGADDMDRIRYVYKDAVKIPIAEHPRGKSYNGAFNFKNIANEYFRDKDPEPAIQDYNRGIAVCPIDTDESQELLAVLVANRSAVLFELSFYDLCITDIDWVLETGWYPDDLRHKILLRKGKSYAGLKLFREATKCVNEAIKAGINAKLSEQKLKELGEALRFIQSEGTKNREVEVVDKKTEKFDYVKFDRNPLYPAASDSVSFLYDSSKGRYAVATKNISAGDVVLEEEAYSLVVAKRNILSNCTHCGISTISPFPCEKCSFALFCSKKCKEAAKYHEIECEILPTIYLSGASINCLLSLRIITQTNFSFLWENRKDFGKKTKGDVYNSKDYKRVYQLCTHSELRRKGEFLHYTFMAVFLLRLLKKTSFFPFETDEFDLKDEEAYIGSLLLRHLQLLQFNAHEISEMRNIVSKDVPYRNCHVGGGIYPTLALFNHSCEPSIIRYNKGTKMIARAIKFINAGDVIYENYGPIYSTHELPYRQKKLSDGYYFDCRCDPCVEDWPLYEELNDDTLRLKCKKCEKVLNVGKDLDNPFVTCNSCGIKNNILVVSMQLMEVDEFTTKAEDLFKQGDYDGAISHYRKAMEFYHKLMVAPFKDMVKVQQRLRTCMLHDGNCYMLYKKPTEFLAVNADQIYER